MTCKDIFDRLKSLDMQVAYSHFKDAPSVPFVVYSVQNIQRYGSDSENMLASKTARIELYTATKNEELESTISKLFSEFEIDSYETYIPEQELYQVVFEFDIIDKI